MVTVLPYGELKGRCQGCRIYVERMLEYKHFRRQMPNELHAAYLLYGIEQGDPESTLDPSYSMRFKGDANMRSLVQEHAVRWHQQVK